MTEKPVLDYSVYLVTGRDLLPPNKSYLECLEEAIKGGVTVVQVREKDAETGEFLAIALQTVSLCSKYNVPVLINDRLDIALASKAAGVHLGQTDMPISVARSLLPANSIIGISCNTPEHAKKAVEEGADYVGLGAVYGTNTKDVTAPGKVRGIDGVREALTVLEGTGVKSVAIGGIKSTNILRTLHGCVSSSGYGLDGVAVVSDIMASTDPQAAARRLADIFAAWKAVPRSPVSFTPHVCSSSHTRDAVIRAAAELVLSVRQVKPLVHQITNNVVKTQSANVTLAMGGSPIMAAAAQEQEELARIPGGLLVNFGTVEDMDGMLASGFHANLNRKPVVFDPVGVGATKYRQNCAAQLLNLWQATVIKGNAAEIGALAKSEEVKAQGVDTLGPGFKDPSSVVRLLARQERCVVVLSGPTDYVSNGSTVLRLSNGHPLLGQITGSGCIVGTAIATFCGAAAILAERDAPAGAAGELVRGDMLIAAAAGVLVLTIAAEIAAEREDVKGPGTFLPALIDELARLTPEVVERRAKVEVEAEI
ncbi:thiamine biosynthetic bifunctional enzyme [Stereum hirsutum FP-91666 SS1]|uniref:thiamine biosynthetic bifunctional enzyme n=1 Tax=Stereum hirsutum (strain FP-91666) TaxID=721885 RepID=UPI00044499BE|nr:thiamine biosynthetic bifunctional enzyme [Stereum hirsutum FP-91666 SS1]EIM83062.1 thiamine biosynthetic bifunctional enzyme [Stereum hirsutum FP-91666 SS1]